MGVKKWKKKKLKRGKKEKKIKNLQRAGFQAWWTEVQVRVDSLCCPCHLSQIMYQRSQLAEYYGLFSKIIFFWGGEWEERKPCSSENWQESMIRMPKSVSNIFTKREAKQPRVAQLPPRAGWCSLMLQPSFALRAKSFFGHVTFAATLCLPVLSFICWCHFVPFSGCQWGRFIPEQMRSCSHPQHTPGSCQHTLFSVRRHSHCTPCLCTALAGNCQQPVGYPHKAGRVPSLALFRCLLRGLLSEMALTSDPAADGVAVVLAGSHSSALQPHVLFPLQRG